MKPRTRSAHRDAQDGRRFRGRELFPRNQEQHLSVAGCERGERLSQGGTCGIGHKPLIDAVPAIVNAIAFDTALPFDCARSAQLGKQDVPGDAEEPGPGSSPASIERRPRLEGSQPDLPEEVVGLCADSPREVGMQCSAVTHHQRFERRRVDDGTR